MQTLSKDLLYKITEDLNYVEILRFMSTCQKHWRLYKTVELWQYLLSKQWPSVKYDNPKLMYRKLSMNILMIELCDRYCRGDEWIIANIYSNVMILNTVGKSGMMSCVAVNLLDPYQVPYTNLHEWNIKVCSHGRLVILEDDQLYQFDCQNGKLKAHTYCDIEGVDRDNGQNCWDLFESATLVSNNILYNRDDFWELKLDLENSHLTLCPI